MENSGFSKQQKNIKNFLSINCDWTTPLLCNGIQQQMNLKLFAFDDLGSIFI
jgi:hypothetical protein